MTTYIQQETGPQRLKLCAATIRRGDLHHTIVRRSLRRYYLTPPEVLSRTLYFNRLVDVRWRDSDNTRTVREGENGKKYKVFTWGLRYSEGNEENAFKNGIAYTLERQRRESLLSSASFSLAYSLVAI